MADLKLRTGNANRENVLQIVGLVLMVAGVVVALLAYEVSLNQNADSAGAGLQLPSPEPPPDVVVEERQKLHNLQGAFGGLSENHHRILVMREGRQMAIFDRKDATQESVMTAAMGQAEISEAAA